MIIVNDYFKRNYVYYSSSSTIVLYMILIINITINHITLTVIT